MMYLNKMTTEYMSSYAFDCSVFMTKKELKISMIMSSQIVFMGKANDFLIKAFIKEVVKIEWAF